MRPTAICVTTVVLLLSLFLPPAQALTIDNYQVWLNQVEYNGAQYYLLTIEGLDPNGRRMARPENTLFKGWVEKVLENTWVWILNQYTSQGRFSKDSHIYQELITKESMLDSRSVVQVLFSGNSFKEIIAVNRIARQGTSSEAYVSLENRRGRTILPEVLYRKLVEWKNYVKAEHTPKELTGIMLSEALRRGYFETTRYNQKTEVVVGETYSEKLEYFVKVHGFDLIAYDPAPGETWTSDTVVETLLREDFKAESLAKLKGIFIIETSIARFKNRMEAVIRDRLSGPDAPTLQSVRFLPFTELTSRAHCTSALSTQKVFIIQ